MKDHDLSVTGELNVQLDAESCFTGKAKGLQGVFGCLLAVKSSVGVIPQQGSVGGGLFRWTDKHQQVSHDQYHNAQFAP